MRPSLGQTEVRWSCHSLPNWTYAPGWSHALTDLQKRCHSHKINPALIWFSLCQTWCCAAGPKLNAGHPMEYSWVLHSQEWSISNFPCSPTGNVTSHSMENVAFHSLLRSKTINSYYFFTLWEWRSERHKHCKMPTASGTGGGLYLGACSKTLKMLPSLKCHFLHLFLTRGWAPGYQCAGWLTGARGAGLDLPTHPPTSGSKCRYLFHWQALRASRLQTVCHCAW